MGLALKNVVASYWEELCSFPLRVYMRVAGRRALVRSILTDVKLPGHNGLVVRDRWGRVILCTADLINTLGGRKEYLASKWPGLFPARVTDVLEQMDQEVRASTAPVARTLRFTDDSRNIDLEYRVTTVPYFRDSGELWGYLTAFTNRQDVSLMEQSSYQSQQQFRSLFESIPGPAVIVKVQYSNQGRLELRLADSNTQFSALYAGTTGTLVLGDDLTPMMVEQQPEFRAQLAALHEGSPAATTRTFSPALGLTFDVRVTHFRDDLLLAIFTDVTALEQSESKLIEQTVSHNRVVKNLHKRIEGLTEDMSQFIYRVAERLDSDAAGLTELAQQAPPDVASKLNAMNQQLQGTAEKMMRYVNSGLSSQQPGLEDASQLIRLVSDFIQQRFPGVKFKAEPLPMLSLATDSFVSAVKNLFEIACHPANLDPAAPEYTIHVHPRQSFVDTTVSVDFKGFIFTDLQFDDEDTGFTPLDWARTGSLRIAFLRRMLAAQGASLLVRRQSDGVVSVDLQLGGSPS